MFASSGLGDLLRPFAPDYLPLEQILQLIFFLYCTVFVLINGKLSSLITKIMIVQVFIAFMSGLINGQISGYTFRTLYIFLMPMFVFSAGSLLRKKYSSQFELRLNNMMTLLFVVLVIQALAYIGLYQSGYIRRLGNSIPILIPILYFTIYKSNKFMYLMPLSIVATGKRITLLSVMFLGLISARKNVIKNLKKNTVSFHFASSANFLSEREFTDLF